jgi:hypothetical protein
MDWIAAAAEWKNFQREVGTHWRQLSSSQLDTIAGMRGRLAEEVRVSYGLTQEQAEQQILSFEARSGYLRTISSR